MESINPGAHQRHSTRKMITFYRRPSSALHNSSYKRGDIQMILIRLHLSKMGASGSASLARFLNVGSRDTDPHDPEIWYADHLIRLILNPAEVTVRYPPRSV